MEKQHSKYYYFSIKSYLHLHLNLYSKMECIILYDLFAIYFELSCFCVQEKNKNKKEQKHNSISYLINFLFLSSFNNYATNTQLCRVVGTQILRNFRNYLRI